MTVARKAGASRAFLAWAVISILLLGSVAVFDAHERQKDRERAARADAVRIAASNASACTLRRVRALAKIGARRAAAAAVDPKATPGARARNRAQAIETQAFLDSTPDPVTIPRDLDCTTLLEHPARVANPTNGD